MKVNKYDMVVFDYNNKSTLGLVTGLSMGMVTIADRQGNTIERQQGEIKENKGNVFDIWKTKKEQETGTRRYSVAN